MGRYRMAGPGAPAGGPGRFDGQIGFAVAAAPAPAAGTSLPAHRRLHAGPFSLGKFSFLVASWAARSDVLLLLLLLQALQSVDAAAALFRRSADKDKAELQYCPVNLHLQRLWVQNSSLRKQRTFDWCTVGAFTAIPHGFKVN